MTILNENTPAAQGADLEFVLQQLAALEPMALGAEDEACNGCSKCSVVSEL
jgi:hypothetical protein